MESSKIIILRLPFFFDSLIVHVTRKHHTPDEEEANGAVPENSYTILARTVFVTLPNISYPLVHYIGTYASSATNLAQ